MKIYDVSELNIEAREAVLLAFEYPVSVKGEITDLRSSKGHQYFKLRDQSGKYTVSCVVWKSTSGKINIEDFLDMEVVVNAKVDFYAGFGQFQLNIIELSEFGDGFLKKQIEVLKKKLSDSGIFDLKKDIPMFPENIAVLTAHDSHALKDVCSKLSERYPIAKIFVYPSIVQGPNAPRNLIEQLRRINRDNYVDLILIVRGGGALQDLMAFNDEGLVREISKSKIPTITGIGHKPDITLADYASDSAQETPTAAAVKAVPDIDMVKQDICHIDISINNLLNKKLDILRNKTINSYSILKVNAPSKKIESFARDFKSGLKTLKLITSRLVNVNKNYLMNEIYRRKRALKNIKTRNDEFQRNIIKDQQIVKDKLLKVIKNLFEITSLRLQQINQMNPKNILKKGYAIIRDKKQNIISNIKSTSKIDEFVIEMVDGQIEVRRKRKKDLI